MDESGDSEGGAPGGDGSGAEERDPVRRRRIRRAGGWLGLTAALAAGVLGLVAGLGGFSHRGPAGIGTANVGYATVDQVVQASANILPKAQVSLDAPASGTLATLDVQDGQHVTAGQVLGVVSSPEAQKQLAEAQQALAQAPSASSSVPDTSAGFASAAAQYQSTATAAFAKAQQEAELVPDAALRSALLSEVQAAQSSFSAAMSSLKAAVTAFQQGLGSASQVLTALGQTARTQDQAAVDAAQATVSALTVVAPITGTVTLGNGQASGSSVDPSEISKLLAAAQAGGAGLGSGSASGAGLSGALGSGTGGGAANGTTIAVGSPVSSGGALFTVTDASTLSVAAQVEETDILTVHPGVTARIQLNAVPGAVYQGAVTSIDPTSSTSSQGSVTYTVRLSLGSGSFADGSPAPAPLPGMSAIADLEVRTATHALSVPSSALVINGQTTSVWVVAKGVAHLRQITLGAQGDAVVQVVSGLGPGQEIVVSGADKVSDGEQLG